MKDPRFGRPWGTRRDFLKSSTAAAAAAYGLFPSLALAEPIPDKFDGSAFKLKAPEANAKPGGVLRAGFPNRPPHFDLHQSGTFFNLGAMACIFDNLIRRDTFVSGNIIPDLAYGWEIAEAG
jgi:ABC-type transport system substrate-binding protein